MEGLDRLSQDKQAKLKLRGGASRPGEQSEQGNREVSVLGTVGPLATKHKTHRNRLAR